MINPNSWGMVVFSKIYVAAALVTATILSPFALSFVPILLLAWHLYLWRRPITAIVNLLTACFMFFTVALWLAPMVGPAVSLVMSLPVLLLINHSLEEAAETRTGHDTRYIRSPTDTCLTLIIVSIAALGVSLLLGSLPLLLASAVMTVYLGILIAVVLRWLPLKPVDEIQVKQRMVARSDDDVYVRLTLKTKIGGLLFVESPYQWLRVSPNVLSLRESNLVVKISLTPSLSGPSVVKLKGQAVDRWGLFQTGFELEPILLFVIPRARYAAWLARKYLAETKPGALPLISNISAIRPIYGLRRGVEYYGSQLYQPGDSLKNIDWKHSLKYNELITKEFAEFHGRSAIILINLAAGDAEEADELAYKIIVTAISFAQENTPAALAVYNHEGVTLTTATLPPRQLLLQSLRVAQEMVTFISPVRYLNPPDIARLRANISRIQLATSRASRVLAQLLQLEYRNLDRNARLNPATKALSQAFGKVDKQSNIVIISQRNHDAEALALNAASYASRGHAVISV